MKLSIVIREVLIEAPRDHVWNCLVDLPGHQTWNPLHESLEGEFREGAVFRFRTKSGRRSIPIESRVVRADGRELAWYGSTPLLGNLLRGHHFFRLREISDRTLLIHGEALEGPIQTLWGERIAALFGERFEVFNEAFKRYCESRVGIGETEPSLAADGRE